MYNENTKNEIVKQINHIKSLSGIMGYPETYLQRLIGYIAGIQVAEYNYLGDDDVWQAYEDAKSAIEKQMEG